MPFLSHSSSACSATALPAPILPSTSLRATLCALLTLLAVLPPALAQRPLGWDASHWEGDLTLSQWQTAYAGGIVFCWTKGTDGITWTDNTMVTNMTNGRTAGLYMGVFHFCHPDLYSATAEANYFVAHAGQYMTSGYLRPVLDLESGSGLGATALSNWVNTFLNAVEQQTGIEPLLYTNTNFATYYLNATVAGRDLWIAQYTTSPDPQHDTPSIGVFSTWNFWQYSDRAYIPGFGNKDADVFNGTLAQLSNFLIGGATDPPTILQQPASQIVPAGGTAVFTVAAGGPGTLSYQWQKNLANLANAGHYSGTTTPTLSVSSVDAGDVASYRCVVTNPYGSVNSSSASLSLGSAVSSYIVESRTGGLHFADYSDTGGWSNGSSKSTAGGCTSGIGHRYCTIASGTPTATYRFTPAIGGSYQVFTTNCTTSNSGNPLVHKVMHAGGTTSVNICQNTTCTVNAVNSWSSLGTYMLSAGVAYTVVLDATAGSGSAPSGYAGRSDAIKWELVLAAGQPGDFDNDTDVDASDFGVLQACLDQTPSGSCAGVDLNGDAAVGDPDISLFIGCLTGPGLPADANCLRGS